MYVCKQPIFELYPYTELTPLSFSKFLGCLQTVYSLHKSKLRWKTHLFCVRHFLIRSIVWSLFEGKLSYGNYDFSVLVMVITAKLCINLIKKCLLQNSSLDLCKEANCMFVNNRDILGKLGGVEIRYPCLYTIYLVNTT